MFLQYIATRSNVSNYTSISKRIPQFYSSEDEGSINLPTEKQLFDERFWQWQTDKKYVDDDYVNSTCSETPNKANKRASTPINHIHNWVPELVNGNLIISGTNELEKPVSYIVKRRITSLIFHTEHRRSCCLNGKISDCTNIPNFIRDSFSAHPQIRNSPTIGYGIPENWKELCIAWRKHNLKAYPDDDMNPVNQSLIETDRERNAANNKSQATVRNIKSFIKPASNDPAEGPPKLNSTCEQQKESKYMSFEGKDGVIIHSFHHVKIDPAWRKSCITSDDDSSSQNDSEDELTESEDDDLKISTVVSDCLDATLQQIVNEDNTLLDESSDAFEDEDAMFAKPKACEINNSLINESQEIQDTDNFSILNELIKETLADISPEKNQTIESLSKKDDIRIKNLQPEKTCILNSNETIGSANRLDESSDEFEDEDSMFAKPKTRGISSKYNSLLNESQEIQDTDNYSILNELIKETFSGKNETIDNTLSDESSGEKMCAKPENRGISNTDKNIFTLADIPTDKNSTNNLSKRDKMVKYNKSVEKEPNIIEINWTVDTHSKKIKRKTNSDRNKLSETTSPNKINSLEKYLLETDENINSNNSATKNRDTKKLLPQIDEKPYNPNSNTNMSPNKNRKKLSLNEKNKGNSSKKGVNLIQADSLQKDEDTNQNSKKMSLDQDLHKNNSTVKIPSSKRTSKKLTVRADDNLIEDITPKRTNNLNNRSNSLSHEYVKKISRNNSLERAGSSKRTPRMFTAQTDDKLDEITFPKETNNFKSCLPKRSFESEQQLDRINSAKPASSKRTSKNLLDEIDETDDKLAEIILPQKGSVSKSKRNNLPNQCDETQTINNSFKTPQKVSGKIKQKDRPSILLFEQPSFASDISTLPDCSNVSISSRGRPRKQTKRSLESFMPQITNFTNSKQNNLPNQCDETQTTYNSFKTPQKVSGKIKQKDRPSILLFEQPSFASDISTLPDCSNVSISSRGRPRKQTKRSLESFMPQITNFTNSKQNNLPNQCDETQTTNNSFKTPQKVSGKIKQKDRPSILLFEQPSFASDISTLPDCSNVSISSQGRPRKQTKRSLESFMPQITNFTNSKQNNLPNQCDETQTTNNSFKTPQKVSGKIKQKDRPSILLFEQPSFASDISTLPDCSNVSISSRGRPRKQTKRSLESFMPQITNFTNSKQNNLPNQCDETQTTYNSFKTPQKVSGKIKQKDRPSILLFEQPSFASDISTLSDCSNVSISSRGRVRRQSSQFWMSLPSHSFSNSILVDSTTMSNSQTSNNCININNFQENSSSCSSSSEDSLSDFLNSDGSGDYKDLDKKSKKNLRRFDSGEPCPKNQKNKNVKNSTKIVIKNTTDKIDNSGRSAKKKSSINNLKNDRNKHKLKQFDASNNIQGEIKNTVLNKTSPKRSSQHLKLEKSISLTNKNSKRNDSIKSVTWSENSTSTSDINSSIKHSSRTTLSRMNYNENCFPNISLISNMSKSNTSNEDKTSKSVKRKNDFGFKEGTEKSQRKSIKINDDTLKKSSSELIQEQSPKIVSKKKSDLEFKETPNKIRKNVPLNDNKLDDIKLKTHCYVLIPEHEQFGKIAGKKKSDLRFKETPNKIRKNVPLNDNKLDDIKLKTHCYVLIPEHEQFDKIAGKKKSDLRFKETPNKIRKNVPLNDNKLDDIKLKTHCYVLGPEHEEFGKIVGKRRSDLRFKETPNKIRKSIPLNDNKLDDIKLKTHCYMLIPVTEESLPISTSHFIVEKFTKNDKNKLTNNELRFKSLNKASKTIVKKKRKYKKKVLNLLDASPVELEAYVRKHTKKNTRKKKNLIKTPNNPQPSTSKSSIKKTPKRRRLFDPDKWSQSDECYALLKEDVNNEAKSFCLDLQNNSPNSEIPICKI